MLIAFIAYLLFVISVFCIFYVLIFIFFKSKFKLLRENLYFIIPIYCIICWAIYYVLIVNFLLSQVSYDFTNYYYCGERVLTKPNDLYRKNIEHGVRYGYKYLPSFAVIVGVPLYLMPSIEIAYKVFYIINVFVGILFVILFNKLLYFMKIEKKRLRILFLFISTNGWLILQQFRHNQTKFWIIVMLLYILIREFKAKEFLIEKNLKYYIINYNIFLIVIGFFPNFIFYFLIYIFHEIHGRELFSKKNIIKYGIIIISFIAQNFLFILSPDLIFDFIEMYQIEQSRKGFILDLFYLLYFNKYFDTLTEGTIATISITMDIILYSILIFLTVIKKLNLIEKFGFLSLSILVLNYVAYRISVVLLPLICLLFISFLNKNEERMDFLKKNKILLIGLIAIFGIYIIPHENKYQYPYFEGITLIFLFLVITLVTSILILYIKKYTFKNPIRSLKK